MSSAVTFNLERLQLADRRCDVQFVHACGSITRGCHAISA